MRWDGGECRDDENAASYLSLRVTLPILAILGGCFATDIRHITSICDARLSV
jgi:hypothetical protein